MTDAPQHTAKLVGSRQLSERSRHLEFEVKDAPGFNFRAGQFVSFKTMHEGRELTRAYSIASGPRGDNRFDLCLNRVDGGYFSNYLCDLRIGGEVQMNGPHGYFLLREPARSALFVATGTGISPLRSMLNWLFTREERHAGREFWLVFGSRSEHDLYYREEFERLASERASFHYLPTLSRADSHWKGRRGYVQELLRELAASRSDLDAYICGLKEMVVASRDLLVKELAWDRKSVFYERYD